MPTYNYSTHGGARVVHLGHPVTRCGQVLRLARITDEMPAGRPMCRRCAESAGVAVAAQAARYVRQTHARTEVIGHLRDGRTDTAIAARMRLSVSTVRRHIRTAMRELGAKTRFDFGYAVCLCDTGLAPSWHP